MSSDVESQINTLKSGGQPLPESIRNYFEPRFGYDFRRVRVHTNAMATESASTLDARAFTIGNNIIFGAGQYSPETTGGKNLLAHELTHVVQQNIPAVQPILYRKEKKKTGVPKKRIKAKGEIKYKNHESFNRKKLAEGNRNKAIEYLQKTNIGKALIAWLEDNSIKVTVYFVADRKDFPDAGLEAVGYFEEVAPQEFNVYIVAGVKSGTFVPTGRGSLEWKEKIVDSDSQSISSTLFHELLHVWFVSKFPKAVIETGHTEKVEPEVIMFDIKTYDEEEYDPQFLKKLKEFDAQRKILLKEEEKRQPLKPIQRRIEQVTDKEKAIPDNFIQNLGSGQKLDPATCALFEPLFGCDFSHVQAHTNAKAADYAKSINAKAFTSGKDIIFREGLYSPNTLGGKKLLAHELTHVVQQFARIKPYLACRKIPENGIKKNYSPVDRDDYLSKVQDAVNQLKGVDLADQTLAGIFLPLLEHMTKKENIIWRDSEGKETLGPSVKYKLPGMPREKIELRLVLDEIDSEKDKFAGHFDASKGTITVVIRRNETVMTIMSTLFHEALHFAVHIIQTYGGRAFGKTEGDAIKTIKSNLSMTKEVEILKRHLKQLNSQLNEHRNKRGDPIVADETVNTAANAIWEEIVVRAETFYFKLMQWHDTPLDNDKPRPNYFNKESVKLYLKRLNVLTERDLSILTPADEDAIDLINSVLLYRQRMLIKMRGVLNAYIPHPLEPKPIKIVTSRAQIEMPPIGSKIEYQPIENIIKSVEKGF